jgi:GTPase SAR1 family protein
VVDVGGQRNERRKWIHCFQEVKAILFCVALSEYDLVLEEDPAVNRMHESLSLFADVLKMEWFNKSSIILFLNKMDLFKDKIQRSDIRVCFPNYDGGTDYDKGVTYIREKFKSKATPERNLYFHVTCATDTENIRFVFSCVQDLLLSESLQRAGFAL